MGTKKKRPRGRPKKAPTERRPIQASCRLTELEAGIVDIAAEAAGMKRSAWIRKVVNAAAARYVRQSGSKNRRKR